jgi:hypothetical protein
MSNPTYIFSLHRILMSNGEIMKFHHIDPNGLSENIQKISEDLLDFLNKKLIVLKSKKSNYQRYPLLVDCIIALITKIKQNPTDISYIQKFVDFVKPKVGMLNSVDSICNDHD